MRYHIIFRVIRVTREVLFSCERASKKAFIVTHTLSRNKRLSTIIGSFRCRKLRSRRIYTQSGRTDMYANCETQRDRSVEDSKLKCAQWHLIQINNNRKSDFFPFIFRTKCVHVCAIFTRWKNKFLYFKKFIHVDIDLLPMKLSTLGELSSRDEIAFRPGRNRSILLVAVTAILRMSCAGIVCLISAKWLRVSTHKRFNAHEL